MNHNFKKYIIFWLSGSVSQLGSAMTSYALILWSYTRTGSAMSVSLMSFFNYLPYIAVSVFAGSFVDRRSKKKIMLTSDSLAAVCSLAVLLLCLKGSLQMYHIYLINAVIVLDLISFLVNFSVLLLFIRLPEAPTGVNAAGTKAGDAAKKNGAAEEKRLRGTFAGMQEGFRFLHGRKGLLYIMLTMALLNFFSRLTYENILSPMILARSGGNERTLGLVNAVLGAGGILGGILVSCRRWRISPRMEIYGAAALSFLFGDLLMGLGRNDFWWSAAAVAASLPIPFITAGQRVLLYETVPVRLQGSVFGVRNALQFGTIPVGILLGGFLADYVFEPFMRSGMPAAGWLEELVGSGAGSGMAVMFLCTGTLGFLASLITGRSRWIKELEEPDGRAE